MSAATYRAREEDNPRKPINISSSFNNEADDKPYTAAEYLENSLGDVLGEVLAKCALKRPDDPITFVAYEFERFKKIMFIICIIMTFRRAKEIQEKAKARTTASRTSAGLSSSRYKFKRRDCSYKLSYFSLSSAATLSSDTSRQDVRGRRRSKQKTMEEQRGNSAPLIEVRSVTCSFIK